jgi:hypothetical protein
MYEYGVLISNLEYIFVPAASIGNGQLIRKWSRVEVEMKLRNVFLWFEIYSPWIGFLKEGAW